MILWLEEQELGEGKINYKLRDWLFSRQRYWGEPIPILHDSSGETMAIDESELPVRLPEMKDFKPQPVNGSSEEPLPPLSRGMDDWKYVQKNGDRYTREFNTMPQWAGSCWYYLRYIDPNNIEAVLSKEKENYWMPVDLYVGGAEHSVLHLLYARFWHKVLYDIGVVSTKEPFKKLVHQGMILGEMEFTLYLDDADAPISAEAVNTDGTHKESGKKLNGRTLSEEDVEKQGEFFVWKENPSVRVDSRAFKMSKSRGNVINPDIIVEKYGADSLRLYEMFMGPLEAMKPWSMKGVEGVSRFLNRIWRLIINDETGELLPQVSDSKPTPDQLRPLHATIKKVTEDIENLRFNTAIASMMMFVNDAMKWDDRPREALSTFVLLLSPFAPHLGEELWQKLGNEGTLAYEAWPQYNEDFLKEDSTEVVVQINGKLRYKLQVPMNLSKEETETTALSADRVKEILDGQTVVKVIVIPNKLVNIVVRK